MQIDSTSGHEGAVVDLVEDLLLAAGWRVQRIAVTAGRDNILATTGSHITVTLSSHLDTVPPFIAPRLSARALHGRGACDAKGIVAAMICAAERLSKRGVGVAMLFVVGEEVSHDGAHAANALANTSKVLINGEPTENTLASGTKGAARFVLRTSGIPAHSAYPHLGKSATLDLARLLVEMQQLQLPSDATLGDTTINIGLLSGGIADNVTAPAAEARLMARLVGPLEDLRGQLVSWLGGRGQLEAGIDVPPVLLSPLPGYPTSVVAFATDIPALTNWGTPYLFGPGSIHVAHTDEEYIALDDLWNAVNAYEELALKALQRES
jgi:acetylornithine deacetylase